MKSVISAWSLSFSLVPNPVAEFKFVALHFGIIRFGIRLSEIVDLKYWIFWAQLFQLFQLLISANPRFKFISFSLIPLCNSQFGVIFSILFRACSHNIVDNKKLR